MNRTVLARAALACVLAAVLAAPALADKPKVTKQDDLPRHSYKVTGTVTQLVTDEKAFAPFADSVRKNLEADLAGYDIQDRTTLQGIQGALLALDQLAGDWDSVLKRVAVLRELESKPAQKLVTGLSTEARVKAIQGTGKTSGPEFAAAFEKEYEARLSALPWKDVQDILQQTKGQMEMLSEPLVLGLVKEQMDPIVAASGELSGGAASQVIGIRQTLQTVLPVKEQMVAALTAVVSRNKEEKPDIWPARELDLSGRANLSPVLVAIWDSGTDVGVFKDRMWTNPKEKENGKDDDKNGFVDDVHGLAFDVHYLPITGPLFDMSKATRPVSELQASVEGLFDMQAAIDSDNAKALRAKMAGMKQDEVKPFMEDMGRYTMYAHGTHVAGIACDRNPAVSLMYSRFEADVRMIPEPPTMDDARNTAKACKDIVAYFKKNGVRVVNMSWVIPRSAIEHDLEANGIGTPEERKKMAREQFEVMKKGLKEAFESAPEILFVGGAGNSDNDVEFDEFIPPMFVLPNLMIAGAVDGAGDATTFTSFGPTVNVYSNGFEVESFVPGGDRVKFSGTSMASPNVVNLAAKLIALDPKLTPKETIALILDGCDKKQEGDRTLNIINPKRSAELLQERRKA